MRKRHLDYVKQYRKVTYTNLLTSGRLNAYLADIDKQAQGKRIAKGRKCLRMDRAAEGKSSVACF